MNQLHEVGVDFVIIDWTNIGNAVAPGTVAWEEHVEYTMTAMCETITEMRAEGLDTPYVVFWVGDNDGSLYRVLYERFCGVEEWKDCFVYWDGKPLILTTHILPDAFPCPELYTPRRMWGLFSPHDPSNSQGSWTFLSTNNTNQAALAKDGTPEQMCVCVASQATVMTNTATAHGRQGGMFWHAQWRQAFRHRPKVVTVTWWNEWAAQRKINEDGTNTFVDAYTPEFSRDIEPMEGGHGDQYYRWLGRYIAAYKAGEACPVLVEDAYKARLEDFVQAYEGNPRYHTIER